MNESLLVGSGCLWMKFVIVCVFDWKTGLLQPCKQTLFNTCQKSKSVCTLLAYPILFTLRLKGRDAEYISSLAKGLSTIVAQQIDKAIDCQTFGHTFTQ